MDQAVRLRELAGRRRAGRGRVVVVASGKGGVGKTNIVVNLGLILVRQEQRVLIFDADLGLANVDILLGLVPRANLQEVINGRRALEEIVTQGPHGLLLVPGASGLQELADLDPLARNRLLDELAALAAGVDLTLVDCGAGISRTVLSFAAAAGEGVVVATPEPTSITDAYGLIKALQRLQISVSLLVNRATSPAEGRETAARIQGACHRFLQLEVPLLGVIPEDHRVGQAVRCQQPFSELYPRCPAARALAEAAVRLLGQEGGELPPGRGQGFWQRLGRLLGR
ncbi:MAG: flagellar biosynthesis protein FlhG [Clostridia bacterium]|nr:flagellar biosynthesis protein FlhG [Clostridia bacterium]